MDTAEMRRILDLSEVNLRVRLHRARLLLRECLEKHWFIETPGGPRRTSWSWLKKPRARPRYPLRSSLGAIVALELDDSLSRLDRAGAGMPLIGVQVPAAGFRVQVPLDSQGRSATARSCQTKRTRPRTDSPRRRDTASPSRAETLAATIPAPRP